MKSEQSSRTDCNICVSICVCVVCMLLAWLYFSLCHCAGLYMLEFKCATISLCLFVYMGVCASVRLHVNVCGDYGGMLVLKGFCPRMAVMDGERDFPDGRQRRGRPTQQPTREKQDRYTWGRCVFVCLCALCLIDKLCLFVQSIRLLKTIH